MTFASAAQAYDGSGYSGFTVCSNSSNDYLVIDHRKGVVAFHYPEIYNKYAILGTDVYASGENTDIVATEYYVFNENREVVFNINEHQSGKRSGTLETAGRRAKVLKSFASCEWKKVL